MMFVAHYDEKRGWRIKADYRPVGGELVLYLVPIAFCLGILVAKAWGK